MPNTVLPKLKRTLDDVPETSFTLSSDYYLDPAIYEMEKKNIFYRTWQYVAHASMLPNVGDYITLKICDENIFVIRSPDQTLRAFFNICRHRAHELLSGSGNVENAIVCPYHAWSYKLDGALQGARMSQGRPEFDKKDFGLREIRLELFCDCVFVNLDPDAEPLSSLAGDMEQDMRARVPYMNELQFAGTDVLGETFMEAGWKVVVDNFVECYHCVHAHPQFASIIKMPAYRVDNFEYWSRQLGEETRTKNTAYDFDPKVGMQGSAFWYLWPNTTFNIMPGAEELSVYAIRPKGATASTFGGHTLTVTGDVSPDRATYVADVLAPEDIRLCESVQRGLRSMSYDQGPFIVDDERSGTGEHALHHFHRLVQRALAD